MQGVSLHPIVFNIMNLLQIETLYTQLGIVQDKGYEPHPRANNLLPPLHLAKHFKLG